MTKQVILFTCAILLAFATTPATAATLGDATKDSEEKLLKSVKVQRYGKGNKKGEGTGPRLDVLEAPPARIGLVSFFVYDKGKKTKTFYTQLTDAGGNHFATKLHDQGIQAIKDNFAAHGMTILTPAEFLDSQGKRNAFKDFKMDHGRVMKMGLKWIRGLEKMGGDTQVSASATSYRVFPMQNVMGDGKSTDSLNELCQQMGLDAVLGVVHTSQFDGKKVKLLNIDMFMYGPNPMPKIEGKRYVQWRTGQCYAAASMQVKKKPEIAELKKKKIKWEDYNGYEKLIGAVSKKMALDIEKEIHKDKN